MSATGLLSGGALKSALKSDDDADKTPPGSGSMKAVQIAEPDSAPAPEDQQIKKPRSAGLARRLSGKLPGLPSSSSRSSIISAASQGSPAALPDDGSPQQHHAQHSHRAHHASQRLLAQVAEWLEHERAKQAARETKKVSFSRRKSKSPPKKKGDGVSSSAASDPKESDSPIKPESPSAVLESKPQRSRTGSFDSQSSEVSLDRLQRIVEDSMAALGLSHVPHFSPRSNRSSGRLSKTQSKSSLLQRRGTASSDTDYIDGDVVVPSCDAVLDNSRTMSYSGGKATSGTEVLSSSASISSVSSRKEEKERQAWSEFKNEIIRLAHTLGLRGWRRVPLGEGDRISVERLSGALTNAVYVVSPPMDIVVSTPGKRPPRKILLRIYGPQVEHLIDRENELNVLRRLARKRIGPRLLGTFTNGRFEEFFNATTLVPANLREPETSKQIAKRMRELHEGIDLLEDEKADGPGVWKNWDHWLENVEKRMAFLDGQIKGAATGRRPSEAWRSRGYVCCVEWEKFKEAVVKYRAFVDGKYRSGELRDSLVFAHNDTQYGNILRIRPDDEKSPLLQPANEHKQLIVIDFEYAAANVRGLEFANHFSEWAYNYHDATAPFACNTQLYPTLEQQRRFIKAYVEHRPRFASGGRSSAANTPRLAAFDAPGASGSTDGGSAPAQLLTVSSSSSIADFMLDARAPPGGWKEEERRGEEANEARVQELLDETRLWRAANSAQWVAWGIVQAKLPGMGPAGEERPSGGMMDFEEAEIDDDEFDYLAYAQERALFFWGDCVLLGIVKTEDLPEDIRERLKVVDR